MALSADGKVAIVGGLRDAWVFTRSGGTWTQEGFRTCPRESAHTVVPGVIQPRIAWLGAPS